VTSFTRLIVIQSSFCRRNRALAEQITSNAHYASPYSLASEVFVRNGILTGKIFKTIKKGVEQIELPIAIRFLKSGVVRVTIDEKRRIEGDIELPEGNNRVRKQRYGGAAESVLIGGKQLDMAVNKYWRNDNTTRVRFGSKVDMDLILHHYPFKMELMRNGTVHVVLNERNLFNMEHWRPKSIKKEEQQAKEGEAGDEQMTIVDGDSEEVDEDGMWEESFNGKTDTKPRGISPLHEIPDDRSRINWNGRDIRRI